MTAITTASLQALVVAALVGKTAAGARVYTPRTWSTGEGDMPILLVQAPKEKKTSLGRSGGPQFDVVTTIRVEGRVYAKAQANDAASAAALAAAGTLQRQIEVAVINDYDLGLEVQQWASVEVQTGVSKDGEVVFGVVTMDFALEFYQGVDDFAPPVTTPIEEMAVYADFLNVYSPADDFTDEPDATPFVAAAEPEPRETGPDGRAEGAVVVTLPQD